MKVLVIGGTVFLGRAFVEAALARGHEVTLFNRGQHNPELFPQVEKLRGDRDGELDVLRGRQWDAILDTCGYYPRVVRQSAQLLQDAAAHYTFISSISAYADFSQPVDENSALAQIDASEAEAADKITGENYGALKVRCEQEVEAAFPNRTLVIRPGIIVGPHDPSDRLTYWVSRVARGGDVLVPGNPEQRIEGIDVRDLMEWNLRLIEAQTTGIYNATGPDYPLTMQQFVETCHAESGSDARFHWVSGEFLNQRDIDPNSVHCWWLPDDEPENRYFWEVGCRRAQSDGLTYRPLEETIRDTRSWAESRSADYEWKIGLTQEKETALLAEWHAQHKQETERKNERIVFPI
jgi:2'-hydroxyisoflavone reductase